MILHLGKDTKDRWDRLEIQLAAVQRGRLLMEEYVKRQVQIHRPQIQGVLQAHNKEQRLRPVKIQQIQQTMQEVQM